MLKLFFYIVSLVIIVLILTNSPSNNNINNFMSQNKLLNFNTNQLALQKIIGANIVIFFILTIVIVIYVNI